MRRGTTPTITYTLPVEINMVAAADITFSNPGNAFFSKSLDECSKSGKKISVTLSQIETLKFRAGSSVKIQCTIRLKSGTVFRSKIHDESVTDTLKGVPV